MAFSDLDQIGSFWWGWGIGLDGLLIFVSSVAALLTTVIIRKG